MPRYMESEMVDILACFRKEDSGAVTVDWVILTAAVVGLALITYVGLADSNEQVTSSTAATILTVEDFLTN